jgi:hypothetical protein
MTGRYCAVVITTHGVILAGNNVPIRRYANVPAGLLHSPGRLFDLVAEEFTFGEGTLLLHRVPLDLEGTHDEEQHLTAMYDAAALAGWHSAGGTVRLRDDRLSGWGTFRSGTAVLHVGILPMLDQSKTPLLDLADDTPQDMAEKLAEYQHRTKGHAFRATAGVVGCAMIRRKWEQYARSPQGMVAGRKLEQGEHLTPLFRQDPIHLEHGWAAAHGDLRWHRRPTADELLMPRHKYDIRSQYLGAAQTALLPWGELEHTGPIPFSEQLAGYWRVKADIPDWACTGERMPPLVSLRRVEPDGSIGLTTPILAHLLRRGLKAEIVETFTAPDSKPWLRPWAAQMRDALLVDRPVARHGKRCTNDECAPGCMRWSMKRTYTEAIGMIGRDGGSISSLCARDMVVDRARVSFWTKIDRASVFLGGITPVRCETDSVTYHHADLQHRALDDALAIEGRVGKFRHVKTIEPAKVAA